MIDGSIGRRDALDDDEWQADRQIWGELLPSAFLDRALGRCAAYGIGWTPEAISMASRSCISFLDVLPSLHDDAVDFDDHEREARELKLKAGWMNESINPRENQGRLLAD